MPRRNLIRILTAALLLAFSVTTATAGELLDRLLGRHYYRLPDHVDSPWQSAGLPPGPHRYGEQHVSGGWYGYGFGVPVYRWGYFGAHYRPVSIFHKGYYNDYSQWGYRHGY